jgi:hypothetical protein
LRQRNLVLEQALLNAADAYYADEDIRCFFAYSHGMITKQINRNLAIFEEPNSLMLLNIHFAEEFVRAIDDGGHERWKQAFRICQALQEHGEYVPGQVEAVPRTWRTCTSTSTSRRAARRGLYLAARLRQHAGVREPRRARGHEQIARTCHRHRGHHDHADRRSADGPGRESLA